MRTWKGAVFSLVGLAIFVLWLGHLGTLFLREPLPVDEERLPQVVGIGAIFLLLLAVSGALSHRGLFLPSDEIERLLSAPVSRSDLVRYRLRAAAVRSLLGGVIVGVMVMRRMPTPLYGFLGALLWMQTVPVVQQLAAILFGGLEHRAGRFLARVGRLLWPLLFVVLVSLILGSLTDLSLARWFEATFGVVPAEVDPWQHPFVVALSRPFLPWAYMMGATDLPTFVLWAAVCALILQALTELTARLPVDFRELSLETSASVAARLRRARSGGGVAASKVSSRAVERRVPWLFGRGPAGAVAWRKTGSILRKARGTVLVSVLVLGFVSFVAFAVAPEEPGWVGAVFIAGLGTLYLCAGLRFDFREELDRMEVIKAWPLGPTRLFLATLLPETVFVSLLVGAAIGLHALVAGTFHPATLGVVAAVPAVVLAWVALDNAVFLFAPVRVVPGHEGALQNAGRGIVLLFLRLLMLAALAGIGWLAFYLTATGAEELLGTSRRTGVIAGFVALELALAFLDALLVWAGGRLLSGFDVAADR